MSIAQDIDRVDEGELEYEPFRRETHAVRNFDCGEKDLDDFLNSEEVESYERENFGRTTLVYHRGELVGYFTTATANLRVEKLKAKKGKVFYKSRELHLEDVPALMIGRFAVQTRWKRRGIGKAMMRHIVGMAFALNELHACRLLILNAKPNEESVRFYRAMKFEFTDDHAEKNRRNKTMFLDLKELEGVV